MVQTKRLTGVILAYTISDYLRDMTIECIKSYKDQLDEVILIEDGGVFSDIYNEFIDIYVYKSNQGFTKSVNCGLRIASGTHVACISTDTYLVEGDLSALMTDTLTSPLITSQTHIEGMAGSFFVVPKKHLNTIGFLNESMKTYGSDEDYKNRYNGGVRIDSVKVYHKQAQTVRNVPEEDKNV